MADTINLKLFRKRRARAEKDEKAAINRAAFGRSKEEKALSAAVTARSKGELDGKKRDR
ncbi:DUF4169 family protein [Aestuariivirga sp.]|jgi:hypothetical protein|uniref:DUF4169 family protein n=1 Tax=Aestuariivirga sp. TaxID=2650926 RepID=UPI0037847BC4